MNPISLLQPVQTSCHNMSEVPQALKKIVKCKAAMSVIMIVMKMVIIYGLYMKTVVQEMNLKAIVAVRNTT